MKKKAVLGFWLIPLALAFGGEKKIGLYTAIDLGRVEKGMDMQSDSSAQGIALNQTYVDVNFTEQLDEQSFISIGVGGLFWKAYEGGASSAQVIKFGPGISNAYLKWAPSENYDLTFGYFPYKYNQAAKNLGEYLFRTEAYPTILYTGGWSWMNDVQYHGIGAKFTHHVGEGFFKQDFTLFGEYFNSPIFDITPAYIATLKPMNGLTLGGAVSYHRLISPTPKTRDLLTQPHQYYANFYLPAVAPDTANGVQGSPAEYVTMLATDLLNRISMDGGDSATYFALPQNQGQFVQTVSFDLSTVKALFFFELNFNNMLGMNVESIGQFNLYGEVAQLGFTDYPIFYTQMSQRMPIMLGMSVPTFGLLNSLSFEVEYLKNPVIQSLRSTYDKLDLPPDEDFRYQVFTKDDYKWSVHASKAITNFFTVYLQVANDHLRLKNTFAQPNYVPLTNEINHWYWLTRVQWAI